MTKNGIIFKREVYSLLNVACGNIIVMDGVGAGLVCSGKGFTIQDMKSGNYWTTPCNIGIYKAIPLTHLCGTSVGYRKQDIIAIYDSIKSWINDGAPGL